MHQGPFLPFRASVPLLLLLPTMLLAAPPPVPDIREDAAFSRYEDSLRARQAWSLGDLRKRYPAEFRPGPAYGDRKVEYGAQVADALNQWDKEDKDRKPLLAKARREGLAVAPDLRFRNFIQAMESIWHADLPILFTTDALLHSIYLSYDELLMELETDLFIPHLEEIIGRSLARLEAVWEKDGKGGPHVQDVRDLLETARYLLALRIKRQTGVDTGKAPSKTVAAFLAAIEKEKPAAINIFGRDTSVDFSQFKPRGHYTKSYSLTSYFQAMMWLSRADLAFHLGPQEASRKPVLTRAKKASIVLWDCIREGRAYDKWKKLDAGVEFLVGTSDGMTMAQMDSLAKLLAMGPAPAYLARFDAAEEGRFDRTLRTSAFGRQMILSQARCGPPGDTTLAPIFSFMPQRFVLDSYSFSRLVHPYVGRRAMPDPLETAFLLGDNSALGDLKSYPADAVPVLAAQRNLYDGLSRASWDANLYTGWLDFLRKLNGAEANPKAAPAFRTATWRAKMRNTQLASWAQLRHNTLLYVKQSFTGSPMCDFPKAYVEPYPEFFAVVRTYARKGGSVFKGEHERAAEYFGRLEDAAEKLQGAAERTAAGKDLTDGQVKWIRKALAVESEHGGCARVTFYTGWYHGLYYGYHGYPDRAQAFTIADVHTKPVDDELGPAQVLHAATGPVEMAVAALPAGDCLAYFMAPISSYYEVTATGTPLTRYSDPEWEKLVDDKKDGAYRPAWTSRFRGR